MTADGTSAPQSTFATVSTIRTPDEEREDATSSCILVMDNATYEEAEAATIQKYLRTHNLVIKGSNGIDVAFTARGLATVADIDEVAQIQGEQSELFYDAVRQLTATIDLTLPVTDEDLSSRLCWGTLRQMLEAQDPTSATYRPLNGISFPNPYAAVLEAPEASDFRAIRRTATDPGCVTSIETEEIRFGLAATPNAFHYPHIDPRGNGTWIRVACGYKLWYLLKFRGKDGDMAMDFWSEESFDIRNIDLTLFRVEVLALRAQDKL